MTILELKNQGYKAVRIGGLEYGSELSEREAQYARRFRQDTLVGSMVTLIIMAITAIFPIVIACVTPESDPPIMKYLVVGFIVAMSLLMIICVLLRSFGPKKVAHAIVITKYSRASRSRYSATPVYFADVYQSYPNKVYARNVQLYCTAYDEINIGDNVAVVKSIVGGSAYREE